MYKKIDKDNEIFKNEHSPFFKDRFMFNIMLKNLDSEDLELYSDEENYIICRGSKDYPTWIWTKDNFDKTKLFEIEELMDMYLTDKEKDKFTCKKELYDLLVYDNFSKLNKEDYFEMGFLLCKTAQKPEECDAFLSKPTIDDKKTLIKYWKDDTDEMNGVDSITKEEAERDVDRFINSDSFYVLRNKDNKIVCMASYSVKYGQAKINDVYTPDDERRKGYAVNLIYLMTKELLDKGLTPLLYTDYEYKASNDAYEKAGYERQGKLINFSCSKEKNKGSISL